MEGLVKIESMEEERLSTLRLQTHSSIHTTSNSTKQTLTRREISNMVDVGLYLLQQ